MWWHHAKQFVCAEKWTNGSKTKASERMNEAARRGEAMIFTSRTVIGGSRSRQRWRVSWRLATGSCSAALFYCTGCRCEKLRHPRHQSARRHRRSDKQSLNTHRLQPRSAVEATLGGGVKASHRYTTPAPELITQWRVRPVKVCAVPHSDSLMKLQPDSNFVSAAILIKRC